MTEFSPPGELNVPLHRSSQYQNRTPGPDHDLCSQYHLVEPSLDLKENDIQEYTNFLAAVGESISVVSHHPLENDMFKQQLIYQSWQNQNVHNLREVFRIASGDTGNNDTRGTVEEARVSIENKPATLAWKQGFVGRVHVLLEEAIRSSLRHENIFCSIIQGTGTGKSRLVDKLAESVFTIPVVLRDPCDKSGYPPADAEVTNFLKIGEEKTAGQETARYMFFLLGILEQAEAWIKKWIADHPEGNVANIPKQWKNYLENQNRVDRTTLFRNAAVYARSVIIPGSEIRNRAHTLTQRIVALLKNPSIETPFVLFYFDESHNFLRSQRTTEADPSESQTAHQCPCKAFALFTSTPLSVLFLSTYTQLRRYTPPRKYFWSHRGYEEPDPWHAPYVELPFDMWCGKVIATEGEHTINEICTLKFMMRFGRPLFWTREPYESDDELISLAIDKLVLRADDFNGLPQIYRKAALRLEHLLPPLALRIDIQFDLKHPEARLLENLLVASSMRTVYSIPEHRQFLWSGYSSEPFLAEAAARALLEQWANGSDSEAERSRIVHRYMRDLPCIIADWCNADFIFGGHRKELVARLLLTLAHDVYVLHKTPISSTLNPRGFNFSMKIPVVDYLRTLVPQPFINAILDAKPQNMNGKPLKEAFADAFVHFHHFIKGDDESVLTDDAYMAACHRGAFIQAPDGRGRMDLIAPIVMKDEEINRWIMSGLIVQIKDPLNSHFTHLDLEHDVDFFTPSDGHTDDEERNSRPYITIAMELDVWGREGAGMDKAGQGKAKKYRNSRDRKRKETHSRYAITIAGCSPKIYNVVADAKDYNILLAHTEVVLEHAWQGKVYLDAIKETKPSWTKGHTTYSWAEASSLSRVGTTHIGNEDAMDVEQYNEEMQFEGVQVSQFNDSDEDGYSST